MTLFRGLCAFPITPADENGRVDTAALQTLVSRLVAAEVDSVGLLGSTGGYPYLTRAERRRAVEAARAVTGGAVPLMAGIGALRTDDAIRFGQDAAEAGADGVLLAPVSYTPLTEEEVFVHFEAVARAVDRPLCIYNNPGTTYFTFSAELIARLAEIPNIAAVKNPAPEAEAARTIAALRAVTPPGFSLGYSTDWNAVEAMLGGADAWHSVLAGLLPELCVPVMRAVTAGNGPEARRLDQALHPLWRLFKSYSSLRVVYAAAHRLQLCRTQPPRPILPLPPAAEAEVAGVLTALGVLAAGDEGVERRATGDTDRCG